MATKPVALTIAGSDSGGGAGIQADIKAMEANGVFAASVLTAVTAQNTQAVNMAYNLPTHLVAAQVDAVMDDIEVAVTKTGMLSTSDIIETVVEKVREHDLRPLIVDPVMMSKSGYKLLQDEAIDTLREALIPEATLVTPNAHEAAFLTDMTIENLDDAREAARQIYARGPDAVIVKGGHLREGPEAVDVYFDGETELTFSAERIDTENTHGTGCTYASSIAAQLARGRDLPEAIDRAKRYVTEAIRHALPIGEGHGPTNHFYHLDPEAALSQIASTQEGAGAAPQSA